MLTKQQIADRIKALDTDVHADATRAFTSAQRHRTIQQMPQRRELMAACNETGGHVFAVSGRCKFCKASDDRPNVANLGVAAGVSAGLSDYRLPTEFMEQVFRKVPDVGLIDAAIKQAKTEQIDALLDRLESRTKQPAPEVISKAPDALPAVSSRLERTIGEFTYISTDGGKSWSPLF